VEEIGKDAIKELREAIANIEIAVSDSGTLQKSLEDIEALRKSMDGLKGKIQEEIFRRVPADKREEVQTAWEGTDATYTIKALIPVTLYVERGGHDWVNCRTDHPYFMDDDIEHVPFPEHVWEEARSYEKILHDRLNRFNDLRYDLKREYGVDAFDILNDE
jgi:hypothetical protein